MSAKTTHAVREAIAAVGYTPNILARALARSSTNTIGLAVSATTNRYFADVINAVEAECAQLGMMVLLANTHDEPDRELEVVAALHQRRVDGIILAPCCAPGHLTLHYLRDKRIPAVMVDRLPAFDLDGVGVENHNALATMVDHLVDHGHRRIGFLAGQATFTTAVERADGFREGLRRHGLPIEEARISIGNTDLAQARSAAVRMLTEAAPVTAFVGANNLTAIGVLMAVRERGLRVPDDIAVVGFDDFEWAEAFTPRLTTMVQPCQAIGRAAALLLKSRIDAQTDHHETMRIEPTFVVRESCGCTREMRSHAGKALHGAASARSDDAIAMPG